MPKLKAGDTLTVPEAKGLSGMYHFRQATLYSSMHTKDPVVYILEGKSKNPYHVRLR